MLFYRRIMTLVVVCVLSFVVAGVAQADDITLKNIKISAPWARASAGMAKAGAAFMQITNVGVEGDSLVSAESNVSKVVELHTHIHDNGVMRMRQVESIPVPAKGEAVLKPGGLHIMFIHLNKPLVEGETFDVTLNFKHAGHVVVPVKVRGVGAR